MIAPATSRWWAGAARCAAALSMLAVTAVWAANGGARQAAGGGWPALGAAGRLAALWSADLMLLQVVLMARIPLVERAFGQDTAARWHRWTGFASFHLLLAHVVLATLAYAAGGDPLAQFARFVAHYPGMLPATAALVAVVLVVVTSVRRARRRLRYESWHLLHLYAYLGVALALPHELRAGSDFVASPAARAYWWTLYALAAGSVLVFRLGIPVWRTVRHRLVVDHVVPEAHGLVSVYLRGRRLDRLPVRAGQFFVWRFLDGPGWSRGNPFSLSGPPHGDQLRITVKVLGDGSARVARLRPGTRALIEGPYGRLTAETYRGGPVTMLACGSGITPLLALLWDLPYGHGQATLIYRARHAREVAFLDELEWLAQRRGVRLIPLIGPRARPTSWLSEEYADYTDAQALRELAPDIAGHDLYVCGPGPWTEAVRAAARAAGVPAARLHRERFGW
ncbi:ferric reductase-like transmembrane domain-containing protein [Couchioplanes caeruleus]|uniref:ferredoxin reductase family protein n=1 Tax=Couchioplanes caeruleus TaxID=56438 RepID=UPI0020BF533D|nr:ferric reductase-like transmembrane domain-containing protein [Couchioplanes caeruleus]UQU63185.1 ferric reductase-like transmembrane domain-containing protein [Couchioplanes caeruleus]